MKYFMIRQVGDVNIAQMLRVLLSFCCCYALFLLVVTVYALFTVLFRPQYTFPRQDSPQVYCGGEPTRQLQLTNYDLRITTYEAKHEG